MHYLALLYDVEDASADPTNPEFAEDLEGYERFGELAGDAIVGGEALYPSDQAVTLRYGQDGPPVVTEGAFPEGTEVIGGLYVLEADDLDAAVDLAKHIPAATSGAIELRPLVEWFQEHRALPDGYDRYLVTLAGTEGEASRPGTPEWEAGAQAHGRFAERFPEAILGGGALHPSEAGTVLRVRGGEVLLTEGAFAEATEVIGGLYLLTAGSREAMIAIASELPMGPGGVVEVRPIVELDG
jgi:hypothetical protein